MRLGLIGYPVSHSWSPRLFARFSERDGIPVRYDLIPMPDVSDLRAFLRENPDIVGLNVTIPHKTAVLSLCDALHTSAERIGAVNTLLIQRIGKGRDELHITGYNTDVGGFSSALCRFFSTGATGKGATGKGDSGKGDSEKGDSGKGDSGKGDSGKSDSGKSDSGKGDSGKESSVDRGETLKGRRALILGTGGAARAVARALIDLGIAFDLVGRATSGAADGYVYMHPLGRSPGLRGLSPQIPDAFAGARRFSYDTLASVPWQHYDLLVHCTPLGMDSGFAGQRVPIDLSFCRPSTLLFDLVYTPETTPLMQHALDCGLQVCGGIDMLELQAEEAWSIWKSARGTEWDSNGPPISSF